MKPLGWEFNVPAGWKYAQTVTCTIAVTDEGAFVVGALEEKAKDEKGKKDWKAPDPRDVALQELASKISVVLPKKKGILPKKPDKVEQLGDLKMSLYQLEGAKRDTQKGVVLLFTSELPDNKMLLGMGFVANDDKTAADEAIMRMLRSLGRSPSSSSGGEAAKEAAPPAASTTGGTPPAGSSAP